MKVYDIDKIANTIAGLMAEYRLINVIVRLAVKKANDIMDIHDIIDTNEYE